MKKTIVLSFIFFAHFFFGQDQRALEENVLQMYQYTCETNYEGLFDHTHPKLFDIVPREQLKIAMEQAFENDDFSITIIPTDPNFEFGEIQEVNGDFYSLIDHDLKMKMTFHEDDGETNLDDMVELFKIAMGTDDVERDGNSITILKRSTMIALSEKEYNHQWYFLNNDTNSMFMDALLPEEAQKALGLKQ